MPEYQSTACFFLQNICKDGNAFLKFWWGLKKKKKYIWWQKRTGESNQGEKHPNNFKAGAFSKSFLIAAIQVFELT